MITEHDLRQALRSQERLAPDAEPVAARITAGVRARRRHRTTAVAAVAAAATAVAVGVPAVLLSGRADRTQQVASPAPAPADGTGRPAPAPVGRFTPLAVPFRVGWLPAGWYADGTLNSRTGVAMRAYEGPTGHDELQVQLWDTKLSGRPAADQPGPGAVVRKRVDGTRWLAVSGSPGRAVLDRVLRSVDLRAPERITFPFRLTWVPAGYRVAESGNGAHHWYGNAAGDVLKADPPLLDGGVGLDTRPDPEPSTGSALWVGVSTEDGSFTAKGVHPNGTLLGRPSRYTAESGLAALHVFGLRGMHVLVTAVTTGRPELTRSTLERLVTGLRMVAHPDRPADWTDQPLP